ncbi:MAG: hypothetical protein JW850_14515 [Thermoflexales bacterium]|nr:hypothetical protein [Thermoflexales bacterium]
MPKKLSISLGILLALVALVQFDLEGKTIAQDASEEAAGQDSANLLINGDFDNPNYSFYWRPTNHYVGGMWYEWFVAAPYRIPEFIDGGGPHHNVCYPQPEGLCENVEPGGNHSQGYILMAASFTAGVYQPVSVTPCMYYTFEGYNRNDTEYYRPKIGIDPTGQVLPPYIPPDGDSLPKNCPPDGQSKCPNPGIADASQLPSGIIWSPEFDHAAYTWAGISVTVEALSSTVSVWTYAAPEGGGSQSAYWDKLSLVQSPTPNGLLAPSGALPAPDGGITDVTSGTLLGTAVLKWNTSHLALSQLLYHYVGPASSTSLPPLATDTSQFEGRTSINANLSTSHSVTLRDLSIGAVYDIALLSRRWMGNQCQTSVYLMRIQTSELLVPTGALPAPDGRISDVRSTAVFNAATLQWQTAGPAYSQILYHYVGPVTATLPPIVNHTQNLEMKTDIDTTTRTEHSTKLYKLRSMSVYDVAILSCTLVDGLCEQSSAYLTRIQTNELIVPDGKLPSPSHEITGPIVLSLESSAYIIWQSSQPAYGQVLYDYIGPLTPTLGFTPTTRLYLPIIAASRSGSGSSSDYVSRTLPVTTLTTLHVVQVSGLITESRYVAVALSAWSEGGRDMTAASSPVVFQTGARPTQLAAHDALQPFVERLHAYFEDSSRFELHDAAISEWRILFALGEEW